MSDSITLINSSLEMDRFDQRTSTCYGKEYSSAMYGFFSQFQDSFFYSNVIQFLIVLLMYLSIGNGKYWKMLFYASIAGLCGALLENATVAYICQDSQKSKSYIVIPFLIDEIFWIVCEYTIPFLNLIKMKAFSKGTSMKVVNYLIMALFIPFAFFRFSIGYERMKKGYLQNDKIKGLHGYAFLVMAIADLTCTISILYFVKVHNNQQSFNNLSDYIKQSSYTILVAVDIVGFTLSILNIITNSGIVDKYLPPTIVTPFHCLKSSFILILASDAILFKYSANTSSFNNSSGANSKYPYSGSETANNNNTTNFNKSMSSIKTYMMNNYSTGNDSTTKKSTHTGSNNNLGYSHISESNSNFNTLHSTASSTTTKSIINNNNNRYIVKNYTNNVTTTSSSSNLLFAPSANENRNYTSKISYSYNNQYN